MPTEREVSTPRLGVWIVLVVPSGFGLLGLLNLLSADTGGIRRAASLAVLAAVFAVQLVHCAPRGSSVRALYGRWTLALQAVLTYLPVIGIGAAGSGMGGFLAGSVLLLLPTPVSWFLFGAVIAGLGALAGYLGAGLLGVAYLVVFTATTGLMVYGVTGLAQLVCAAQRARSEYARLAVDQERSRFARDLHDLLGYSLSAITLKCEFLRKLAVADDARARRELTEVLEISRQALSDVREVCNGYRNMSLADEVASVRGVLHAAGIAFDFDAEVAGLPAHINTALATVLREGVTNLLLHSRARSCRMSIRQVHGKMVLTLSNDGVIRSLGSLHRRRGGLDNLAARMAAADGEIVARTDQDGWFHLIARCPARRDPKATGSGIPARRRGAEGVGSTSLPTASTGLFPAPSRPEFHSCQQGSPSLPSSNRI